MRITADHLLFYMQKKHPTLSGTSVRVGVDRLIPKIPSLSRDTGNEYCLHNTLQILRSSRKRGKMMEQLAKMSESGQCTNAKRREGYCKKWLKRIDERI